MVLSTTGWEQYFVKAFYNKTPIPQGQTEREGNLAY